MASRFDAEVSSDAADRISRSIARAVRVARLADRRSEALHVFLARVEERVRLLRLLQQPRTLAEVRRLPALSEASDR